MKLQKALFESSSRPVSAQSFLGTRVAMALFLAEELDATNIGVSTIGSTVTLSGEVDAVIDRLAAERITREVLGVSLVRSRLVNAPRVAMDSTSRT
jgi:osmotically-inducible protein OsmY